MNEGDDKKVLAGMRLASGVLWPMPINLDVTGAFAEALMAGDETSFKAGYTAPNALIAATALEKGLQLSTRDITDFEKVRGLRVKSPR